ncbi:unnamed protein product, partial [Nesidiocoris tenuis]
METDILEFAKTQLTLPDKIDPGDEMSWQHYLYSKLGNKKEVVSEKPQTQQLEEVVDRIVAMAKVLFGLHMVLRRRRGGRWRRRGRRRRRRRRSFNSRNAQPSQREERRWIFHIHRWPYEFLQVIYDQWRVDVIMDFQNSDVCLFICECFQRARLGRFREEHQSRRSRCRLRGSSWREEHARRRIHLQRCQWNDRQANGGHSGGVGVKRRGELRLARFLETAGSVLNYFEPFLGRIEIMGSSKKIERVYFEIKESNIEQWEKPQIKESKRAFFYSIVTEGGDKEKLEAFVNFCEDAIFEMQHASGLMASEEETGGGGKQRNTSYSYISEDDEEKYIGGVIYSLMSGPTEEPVVEVKEEEKSGPLRLMPALPPSDEAGSENREESQPPKALEGTPAHEEGGGGEDGEGKGEGEGGEQPQLTLADILGGEAAKKEAAQKAEAAAQQEAVMQEFESVGKQETKTTEPSAVSQVTSLGEDGDDDGSGEAAADDLLEELSGEVASAMDVSRIIGSAGGDTNGDGGGSGEDGGGSGEEDDEEPLELVHVDEDFFYMAHVIRVAAIIHTLVSLALLIAYYQLKVVPRQLLGQIREEESQAKVQRDVRFRFHKQPARNGEDVFQFSRGRRRIRIDSFLVLTVMLLTIVVWLYTVVAFNFFRKFYVSEEDEEVDKKCHDMMTCFVFHLYKGVRAGGGIGDEIEPPDGDDYEVYRIMFDITFFFFVIVILLAIIQGLIIDAFGELRDQLESVKEDMESNCFICGIGKDYFDKVPHGFDTHVAQEHNLANY